MMTAPTAALRLSRGTGAQFDRQLRQQPARHHRADDADDDISQQAKAAAPHDQAGQPATIAPTMSQTMIESIPR